MKSALVRFLPAEIGRLSFDLGPAASSLTADAQRTDDELKSQTPYDDQGLKARVRASPPAVEYDELFAQTIHSEPTTEPERFEPKYACAAPAEEDPLAEVNAHLAYERFDEAERLIREAIAANPAEAKYKLRLLEVYYSSNDRTKYEAAARDLLDAVGGQGPLWDSAVAMWREMSPDRELFTTGVQRVAPPRPGASASTARESLDITTAQPLIGRGKTNALPDSMASRPAARRPDSAPQHSTQLTAGNLVLEFECDRAPAAFVMTVYATDPAGNSVQGADIVQVDDQGISFSSTSTDPKGMATLALTARAASLRFTVPTEKKSWELQLDFD